jgi:hypothetical protein
MEGSFFARSIRSYRRNSHLLAAISAYQRFQFIPLSSTYCDLLRATASYYDLQP